MWLLPVVLGVLVGYIVQPILNKKMAGAPSRARSLVWQFAFAAIYANVICVATGSFALNTAFGLVFGIGVANAFANYSYWRAIDMSLSKTSLFTQADDLIALGLGYVVLHEYRIIGPLLGAGLVLLVGSALVFSYEASRRRGANGVAHVRGIALWIALYSVIWGIAAFSGRYFAFGGTPLLLYICAWYSGSFVGSLGVFALCPESERGAPISTLQIGRAAVLAATIMTSMSLAYWARSLAPITVTQPLYQLAEMVLPTVVGLWYFKEKQALSRVEKIAIAIALVGGTFIAFSY